MGMTSRLAALRGLHTESVVQDVDIPIGSAPRFLELLHRKIGILPVWICPVHVPDPGARFALYPLEAGTLYVNFGFWDLVESRQAHERGHFNRLVERETLRMGGIKSLYSDSFFTRGEFDRAYDMAVYAALKQRYDADARAAPVREMRAKALMGHRPAAGLIVIHARAPAIHGHACDIQFQRREGAAHHLAALGALGLLLDLAQGPAREARRPSKHR